MFVPVGKYIINLDRVSYVYEGTDFDGNPMVIVHFDGAGENANQLWLPVQEGRGLLTALQT